MDIGDYLQAWQGNPNPTPGPAPQQPPPHGGPRFNVLEKGADTAIQTARQAMGMNHPNRGMRPYVQLASDVFRANMMASRHPGMQAMGRTPYNPYAQQDAEVEENLKVANYLHKAEEARRMHEYKQQQLNEQRRHHMAHESAMNARSAGSATEGVSRVVNIEGQDVDLGELGFSPIEGKAEMTRLQKSKSNFGNVLTSIDHALKQLDELEEITKGDFMKPTDPRLGSISQSYTNAKASMGNKHAIQERNATKILNDSLTKVRILIESATKGGLPGEQMMKRFEEKGILPHLGDSASTIREKLNVIRQEISNLREAADVSIKGKSNVDPYDLGLLKEKLSSGNGEQNNAQLPPAAKLSTSAAIRELEQLKAAKAARQAAGQGQ